MDISKFYIKSNKVRTALLIAVNTEFIRTAKRTNVKLNSELPDDICRKYDSFEVTLQNPTIIGSPRRCLIGQAQDKKDFNSNQLNCRNFMQTSCSQNSQKDKDTDNSIFVEEMTLKKVAFSKRKLNKKVIDMKACKGAMPKLSSKIQIGRSFLTAKEKKNAIIQEGFRKLKGIYSNLRLIHRNSPRSHMEEFKFSKSFSFDNLSVIELKELAFENEESAEKMKVVDIATAKEIMLSRNSVHSCRSDNKSIFLNQCRKKNNKTENFLKGIII